MMQPKKNNLIGGSGPLAGAMSTVPLFGGSVSSSNLNNNNGLSGGNMVLQSIEERRASSQI
jgi:hypothetical protein